MRRVDAIAIVLGVFVAGGLAYVLFQLVGLDSQQAGIWSQVLLVSGLIGWLVTYVSRAVAKKMTYHEQREKYEQAFFEKRLQELSPEELAQIQAEIQREKDDKAAM
jgi:high-affinity Fe2+/Pb2+ permease